MYFRTPLVWSPAFRRPGPAKAGTPNGRFMESRHSFFRMHWDHEPTPSPSQEGSDSPVPLLGGVRGGLVGARFMESLVWLPLMHRDLEPRDRSANLRSGAKPVVFPIPPGRRPALRHAGFPAR